MSSDWVQLTEHSSKAAILVNLATATSIRNQKQGGTAVSFGLAGTMRPLVVVSETLDEVMKAPRIRA